jgi:hypothetical protein
VSRIALLLVMIAATGCVTTGSTPPDVGNFKGQASQPILAKLGAPDSRESVAGGTLYRWRSSVRQESAPTQRTVVDYSSGQPMTHQETVFRPQTETCMLSLTVDASGRVSDFQRDGSRQACAPLLDQLGLR